MEYRKLGKTGLKVSGLCFGTLTFGREANKDTSLKLFEKCREAGINFFDTAKRYSNPDNHTIAKNFVQYAKENNLNPAALAVAWVMANPVVTSPIIGARNINQLEQVLTSLEIKMTPERYKEITSLSISPPLATDRDEEKEKNKDNCIQKNN